MNLKTARLRAELTQEQLAERTGIDQSTISAIERGAIKSPAYDTVVRLARALDISPDELFPVPDEASA